MKQLPIFKCRASQVGLLHTGFKEATAKDIQRIKELEHERDTLTNANGNKVKWTDAKAKELDKLVYLAENPQLGETAKTMLKDWVISQLTGKEKDITSKYFEHGIFAEGSVLERASKYFGCTFTKNKEQFENDFFTGEPDAFNDELVIDVKSPYSSFTFPYFEQEAPDGYYGQLQVYMALTGLKKASLVFGLENHSEDEIDRLASKIAWKKGKEEPDMEDWNEAKEKLTYDNIPEWMRIRTYDFEYSEEYIKKSEKLVILAREYIEAELLPQLEKLKA